MENEITLDFLVKYFTENYKGEIPKELKIHDKFNLKILESFNSKNFCRINQVIFWDYPLIG